MSSSSVGVIATLVLLDGERGQAVTRLRRDDHAGPAAGHHLPEFLEHNGSAVEIDMEDRVRRRLARRDASRVDEPNDLPTPVALPTKASTASREETSTVATFTWYPAVAITSAAPFALASLRSASTTCFPTPTRLAMA